MKTVVRRAVPVIAAREDNSEGLSRRAVQQARRMINTGRSIFQMKK